MTDATESRGLLRAFGRLAAEHPPRADQANELASALGARELVVFVRDESAGQSLPAPGFPQTLRHAREWHALVERAIAERTADGTIGDDVAHAIGTDDGTAIVFVGGTPQVESLRDILPLLGAALRMDARAQQAVAEANLARQSASRVDATRAELQKALTIAETATRARDEFLATVSHELRTPLTSIIGWIHLLRGDTNPSYLGEALDTIERNAQAQRRLVDDLLDFSRINAGKLRLDVQPIELTEVINPAIEVVRPGADAKGVVLDSVLDPNAGLVSGDADRLQQVVWNLLSNAVKFTPRGGRVQIRLERVDSYGELSVSDTGEGIAPDFLPYVFDRFSQADSSLTRKHGGLGLGLGIVRHLVELHGGRVHAFSAGLGKGATFVVRLPLLIAHVHRDPTLVARNEAAAARSSTFADLTDVSVLVVEDNDDARALLTTILKRCGAAVEAARNVSTALQLLSVRRPDILISDIEMPGEDGYSLIRKIRLDEPRGSRIPAIALTAYTRSIDRVRALAAGFQAHMGKPVEPAELVAAVKSLVSTTKQA